jgi:hypothetical protein
MTTPLLILAAHVLRVLLVVLPARHNERNR